MNPETFPLGLYKANVELQLHIARLLQEGSHRWLEAAQQCSAGSMLETTARIEGLLRAADWQALSSLPSEVFLRAYQGRVSDAQTINQIAMRNQTDFAAGLQQAMKSWQETVSETWGGAAGAEPFASTFRPWMQPLASAQAASPGKTRK